MTVGELREILANMPDTWIVVVEQPEGDRYETDGARRDEAKSELVIEL
jgi:hypothetical protein